MEKVWIKHVKTTEDKIIEYALQYALLDKFNAEYDYQKKSFVMRSRADSEDMRDFYLDMLKQEARHLVIYRSAIPFFGLIENDDDLKDIPVDE